MCLDFYQHMLICDNLWNYKLENQERQTKIIDTPHCWVMLFHHASVYCPLLSERKDLTELILFCFFLPMFFHCWNPFQHSKAMSFSKVSSNTTHKPSVTFWNSRLLHQGPNARDTDKYSPEAWTELIMSEGWGW